LAATSGRDVYCPLLVELGSTGDMLAEQAEG
jgi:hypothetical protein